MKVLVALDGSSFGEAIIHEVCNQTWPTGSILKLVTVDPPLESGLVKGTPSALDEILRKKRAELTETLKESVRIVQECLPGVSVESQLLEGWPKEAILDEAEKWGSDLIAVGSHGYGAIRRFFLGSISLAVATNAHCSVLIVRPKANV